MPSLHGITRLKVPREYAHPWQQLYWKSISLWIGRFNYMELANTLKMKVSEYQVIREKTEIALQQKVNRAIRQGWVPIGGISAAAFGISPVGGNLFL